MDVQVHVLRSFLVPGGGPVVTPLDSPVTLSSSTVRQLEESGVPYVERVDEGEEEGEEPGPSRAKPVGPTRTKGQLMKESLDDLKGLAKRQGLSGYSSMNKEPLAEMLADA